ncbi:MAG: box helicase family protein [Gammaproteobacteria bacterium]|nr:box helicase family protein [Gammaproteobacteria bacterium]
MTCTEGRTVLTREQVLNLSRDEMLQYFHRVTVQHPRMSQALEELMVLSAPNTGTDLILMIGPTGAGKSATIGVMERKFLDAYSTQMQADAGFIPIACIEAPASGELSFSWRILYGRLGEALNEPLLERKVLTIADRQGTRVIGCPRGTTVAALRVSIEKALQHRRTRLLVIDEAAHILCNCGDAKLTSHVNALKSLANVSGVTLALVGSYDLYRLPTLSGQLARRTAIIHLQRYRVGDPHDEECFRRSLRTLQRRLPLQSSPDLERYSVKLQVDCAGCIGTLKETLMRSLAIALEKGGTWKDDYLRRALLSEAALAAILEETLAGEKMLAAASYGDRSIDFLQSA